MEQRIRTAWTTKWAGARQLAQPILSTAMQKAVVGSAVEEGCGGNADDSAFE
jgi:hypothetical protein